jgi:hypothetical protein
MQKRACLNPSCASAEVHHDDDDEPYEADKLHGKEAEAKRNHRVCLNEAHVHERLRTVMALA